MKTFTIPTELLKQIGQNNKELPRDTLGLEIAAKNNNAFYPRTFILENGETVLSV